MGGTHLDPGGYTAAVMLPTGATLQRVEVAPAVPRRDRAGRAAGASATAPAAKTSRSRCCRPSTSKSELPPAASAIELVASDFRVTASSARGRDGGRGTGTGRPVAEGRHARDAGPRGRGPARGGPLHALHLRPALDRAGLARGLVPQGDPLPAAGRAAGRPDLASGPDRRLHRGTALVRGDAAAGRGPGPRACGAQEGTTRATTWPRWRASGSTWGLRGRSPATARWRRWSSYAAGAHACTKTRAVTCRRRTPWRRASIRPPCRAQA